MRRTNNLRKISAFLMKIVPRKIQQTRVMFFMSFLLEKKKNGFSLTPIELTFTINSRDMEKIYGFINHIHSPNIFLQNLIYYHQYNRFPHNMIFSKNIFYMQTHIWATRKCAPLPWPLGMRG